MRITVVPPSRAGRAVSAHAFPCPSGSAFRAVPLLSSFDGPDGRLVAIGQTRIVARPGAPTEVEVVVRALWHAPDREDWQPIQDHAELAAAVSGQVRARRSTEIADPDSTATGLARRLAESSRDHVGSLRSLRYGLERSLGDALRGRRSRDLESILATIVEVSAMCGRAGAQEKFNLLAGVGAILFGLPALIVGLYGAGDVLPVSWSNWAVLLPLGLAGLVASAVAALLPAKPRRRAIRFGLTLVATLIMVATLAYAGALVTPRS